MTSQPPGEFLDPAIFEYLKSNIEEEQTVRDELTQLVQKVERSVSHTQGLLSRVHFTPRSQYTASDSFLNQALECLTTDVTAAVANLATLASQHPYYKYNFKWSRTMQSAVYTRLLYDWLERAASDKPAIVPSLTEIGEIMHVEVNLKDRDAFHVTIEEYLLALTDLTGELSRLATNAVTLGDFALAVRISVFIKDLFAGFQQLNLKNDILRKRVDGVKYDVKKVEDVVYDLTLRNLIPRPDAEMSS